MIKETGLGWGLGRILQGHSYLCMIDSVDDLGHNLGCAEMICQDSKYCSSG